MSDCNLSVKVSTVDDGSGNSEKDWEIFDILCKDVIDVNVSMESESYYIWFNVEALWWQFCLVWLLPISLCYRNTISELNKWQIICFYETFAQTIHWTNVQFFSQTIHLTYDSTNTRFFSQTILLSRCSHNARFFHQIVLTILLSQVSPNTRVFTKIQTNLGRIHFRSDNFPFAQIFFIHTIIHASSPSRFFVLTVLHSNNSPQFAKFFA